MKYEKRKTYELKLSERQLEQISSLRIMDLFIDRYGGKRKLKDISNINLEWIEQQRYKKFSLWHIEELKKNGVCDIGMFKLRKSKKGYVLEMNFKWVSKGINSKQVVCSYCKKSKLVNYSGICEKCEKLLKSKKKYSKFVYGGL